MKQVRWLAQWLLRWRWLLVLVLLAALFGVYAHRHNLASAISEEYAASGKRTINLAQAVPSAWTKVCILGPYSTAANVKAMLGFDWKLEAHSRVGLDDTVVLLVFANEQFVVAATDYPRRSPDFTPLAGKCYARAAAVFTLG